MNTMKKIRAMSGFAFGEYQPEETTPFERLFEVFKELIIHTSGDFDEAIDWLRQLDQEYELTTEDYTIDDFIEDLIQKGFIQERIDPNGKGGKSMTSKLEQALRQRALNQIFGKMRKSSSGNHHTQYTGNSDEKTGEFRNYRFGDSPERISIT